MPQDEPKSSNAPTKLETELSSPSTPTKGQSPTTPQAGSEHNIVHRSKMMTTKTHPKAGEKTPSLELVEETMSNETVGSGENDYNDLDRAAQSDTELEMKLGSQGQEGK